MIKIFRSILKEGVIYSLNYNTFCIDLRYKRCLDIDNIRTKSRVKDH